MRPALLEIEGFTCYRDLQTLEFDEVDGPMAISGPTGSGKSTLLDAMLFALYGKVPRVNKQVGQLVSSGLTKAAIRFEFVLGEARYRVVRTVYSNTRPATAQLERVDIGQRIEDGVRPVNLALEELLGLGADAFMQSVVLPQGQFAKFLKADGKSRRDLLFDLLGVDIYTRMQKRANARAQELSGQVSSLEDRIKEDFDGVSAEALLAAKAEVERLEKEQERLNGDEKAQREIVAALTRRHELTTTLHAAREELAELRQLQPERDADRDRLGRSRRALQVVPLHRQAALAASELEARTSSLADLQELETKAADALAIATTRAEEAVSTAGDIPDWRRELEGLVRIEGRLRVVVEADKKADKAASDHKEAQEALGVAASRVSTADEELRAALHAATAAGKTLTDLAYDVELHDRLNPLRGTAERLAQLESAQPSLEEAVADAASAVAEHRTTFDAARTAEDEKAAALSASQAAVLRADEAVRAARDKHRAAALRAHLQDGDTCPVCEQRVDLVPAAASTPELESRDRTLKGANGDARAAKTALDNATTTRTEAEKAHDAATTSHVAAVEARDKAGAEAALLRVPLSQAWPDLVDGSRAAHTLATLTRLDASKAAATEAIEIRTRQTTTAEALQDRLVELRTDQVQREGRVTATAGALADAKQEQADARSEVGDWTTTSLIAERDALTLRITNAEAAARATTDELGTARTKAATATTQTAEAVKEREKAAELATALRDQASTAATGAGFATSEEAADAQLIENEREELEAVLESFARDLARATDTITATSEKLADGEVTKARVDEASALLEALSSKLQIAVERLGTKRAEVRTLTERLERASALSGQLAGARTEAGLYTDLAAELRGNRFPQWLLEAEFDELVRNASERLYRFTDRYTLTRDEQKFLVVDHDNAQEARSTDTLSGGETFLCSLALALELSDQIQRRAGNRRFDCLFIDEGFGTLDPDTLDTVAEAIEVLGAGDRLVGLISHVGALTERMPWRIVVTKGPDGSQAKLSS